MADVSVNYSERSLHYRGRDEPRPSKARRFFRDDRFPHVLANLRTRTYSDRSIKCSPAIATHCLPKVFIFAAAVFRENVLTCRVYGDWNLSKKKCSIDDDWCLNTYIIYMRDCRTVVVKNTEATLRVC